MKTQNLSAVLLTFNEEDNIKRSLNSLSWLNKVYVIDSFSSDMTSELCSHFNNVVFVTRRFDDHASQWNFGLDLVNTEWVLTLDADHVLDYDWHQKWLHCDGKYDGYLAEFRYLIHGYPLRSCLYPRKVVLFRKCCGRFIQDGHTQRLILNGKVGIFPAKISHDDRKKTHRWVLNQINYCELEATKILRKSQMRSIDKARSYVWIMPIIIMPYCLFVKGLILDGRRGWVYTLQRLIAETLISILILEKKFHEENKC
jgi:glycosyltransferase involved in cell wall biosynthesis